MPWPTCVLGLVKFTRTARPKALLNASRRWRWIEIWPTLMPASVWPRFLSVAPQETEAHVHEALRLSPRDTYAFRWMMFVGHRQVAARRRRGSGRLVTPEHRGQPKLSRSRISVSPPPWRCSARWMRRGPPRRPALRSIRASPSAASAPAHRATIRPSLPDASASMRACAWPGCRRGNVRVGVKLRSPALQARGPLCSYQRTSSAWRGTSGRCRFCCKSRR